MVLTKGNDGAAHAQQTVTGFGVRDIAELGVGNVKQLRQLCPVGCRLIEEQQKFRVGEHQTRRFDFKHSSTFWLAAVNAAPYLRNLFHAR